MGKQVIVLGAGIVGVCCALELQRRGMQVTLVDRQDPGRETSFGNAGILARSSLMPFNHPGLWRQLPRLLGNDTVQFLPDSATLADPAAARGTLGPLISTLTADPTLRVTLVGTCASGDRHATSHLDPIALSSSRAHAIKSLLTGAGISADRITATGVGTDFPEFVPDLDADGNLLYGPAALNRTVRVRIEP